MGPTKGEPLPKPQLAKTVLCKSPLIRWALWGKKLGEILPEDLSNTPDLCHQSLGFSLGGLVNKMPWGGRPALGQGTTGFCVFTPGLPCLAQLEGEDLKKGP